MGLTFQPHNLLFQCEHLTSGQSVQHCFFAHPRLCPSRPELLLPHELELCHSQPGHHHDPGRRPSFSRRFMWQLHSHLKGRPGPPPPTSQSSREAQSHQDESRALQWENELWGQLRGAQITAELSRTEPSMVLSKPEAYADAQHSAKLPSPLLSQIRYETLTKPRFPHQ